MCGNCNDPLHGLNDDLDDLFGPKLEITADDFAAGQQLANAQQYRMHEETCKSCGGSGKFRGYSGRVIGDCFKCKGKGVRYFRQSLEKRQQQAQYRADRKAREQQSIAEQVAGWAMQFGSDYAWINAKAATFDFAASMRDALNKYGHLTAKQHETVIRLRERDEQRDAERRAEREQREASAPVVSLEKIEEAFAAAQGNGIKRPKLRLDTFKFSLAPATGRNAGAIYVVDAEGDQYLGKIAGGKFFRVRECTDDQEKRIVAVAADPKAAAIAYGRRTGNCCICGRELTNHASIDLGIGPICAGRMGW